MKSKVTRRKFLEGSAAAGLAVVAAPAILKGRNLNNKLNIACIGVGGRGRADLNGVRSENIVALCDVNGKSLARAAKGFPGAKTYADWRKCLEQKDIDAVVCATTDHTHAFISMWAMNRGKHVYCEKPLANSVEEARLVREKYLKNKDKIATQHGTQIHATDNYRRVVELIRAGAIGTPKSARVWCSRIPKGGDYLPAVTPVPADANWDLWIGPSQMHPYNPGYFGNCLTWNRFWDFGSGQIGDMGSHMMDLATWGLDLGLASGCKATGSKQSKATVPTWLTAEWEHPANDWRPAVEVYWYDGGKKPGMPSGVFNRDKMFKGVIFRGTKGTIVADYSYRIMMMTGDMTHYKSPKPEELIPKSPGHHKEWIIACKTGKPTLCNFDYAGKFIENNMLSLVAYRVGKKLAWDSSGKSLKATGCPEADQYIKKTYRKGWVLDG
ncbi:MAG: Gfo/Idh/MocA family oxidoreductase [bacterium]|nr:Gfo/Idh/MocA family oxidoreductase [bacterium]